MTSFEPMLDTRTMARIQEVAEAHGYSHGYDYEGPSLSKDARASEAHQLRAKAFAATIAGSRSVPPPARTEAFEAARSFYQHAFMKGRVARATLPPLALPSGTADMLDPQSAASRSKDQSPDRPV